MESPHLADAQLDLLDKCSAALTVVLNNHDFNSLHDAATFSRLLCVNKQLHSTLLTAAVSRIHVSWPSSIAAAAQHHHSMVLWLQHHVQLGTLARVGLCEDLLSMPLHDHEGLLQAAEGLPHCSQGFINGVACALASAAAYLGPGLRLPVVEGWCSCELLPASLSQLPAVGDLTQLVLTVSDTKQNPTVFRELAALTALRELRLPMLSPAPDTLAPLFKSALTQLTGLLLVKPGTAVLRSIPVSTRELVLVPSEQRLKLQGGFDLQHLTALQTLHLQDPDAVGFGLEHEPELFWEDDDDDHPGQWVAGLKEGVLLPNSLTRVATCGLYSIQPLLAVTGLKELQLNGFPPIGSVQEIAQVSSLTQVTAVTLLQCPNAMTCLYDVWTTVGLLDKLPIVVPRLDVAVPATALENIEEQLHYLAQLTSLTRLQLRRQRARRAAAILTAAAAAGGNAVGRGAFDGTVQQFADVLSQLTNLSVLGLHSLPLVSQAGAAALRDDWRPLISAVAALPRLQQLQCEDLPLGPAVTALSAAAGLSSLKLVNCRMDDAAVVGLVQGLRSSSCLQGLTIFASTHAEASCLTDVALGAVVQHLQHLKSLHLLGTGFTPAGVEQVSRLRLLEKAEVRTDFF